MSEGTDGFGVQSKAARAILIAIAAVAVVVESDQGAPSVEDVRRP